MDDIQNIPEKHIRYQCPNCHKSDFILDIGKLFFNNIDEKTN